MILSHLLHIYIYIIHVPIPDIIVATNRVYHSIEVYNMYDVLGGLVYIHVPREALAAECCIADCITA